MRPLRDREAQGSNPGPPTRLPVRSEVGTVRPLHETTGRDA